MIGSLLYYVFYPLSKLIDRLSESWWKAHPSHPGFINGTDVGDGDRATFRRLSGEQIALLDQWCSTSGEHLEKPTPNKKRLDTEGLVESRPVLETMDMVAAKKKEQQEEHLVPKYTEKMVGLVNSSVAPDPEFSEECRNFTPTMEKDDCDLPEEKKAGTQLAMENDHMNIPVDGEKEVNSLVRLMFSTIDQTKQNDHDAFGSRCEFSSHEERKYDEEMGPVAVQLGDEKINIGESETQVSEGSCVFNLSELLADNHADSMSRFTQFQSVSDWHFPVGQCLTETVDGPSLQFPSMSYYPALEDNSNFEGKTFAIVIPYFRLLTVIFLQSRSA